MFYGIKLLYWQDSACAGDESQQEGNILSRERGMWMGTQVILGFSDHFTPPLSLRTCTYKELL